MLLFALTNKFSTRLSNILYGWLLDERGRDGGESFTQLFSNARPEFGHGMEICLCVLIIFSAFWPAIFYKLIATKLTRATKSNFLWVWFSGYIFLVIFTPLILKMFVPEADVFSKENIGNLLSISGFNFVYYTILYGVSSSLWKEISKSKMDLWSCLFK